MNLLAAHHTETIEASTSFSDRFLFLPGGTTSSYSYQLMKLEAHKNWMS